jgi:excisionase family DNA binding protein
MANHEYGEDPEPLLTATDVARVLKVKTVTVHAAAADGRIPCIRVWTGKRRSLVRFRRSDIERLLRNGVQSGGEVK